MGQIRIVAAQKVSAKRIIDPISHIYHRTGVFSAKLRKEQKDLLRGWMESSKYDSTEPKLIGRLSCPCLHWLFTGRKCNKQECYTRMPMWLDHYEFWVDQERRPYAVVSHPYQLFETDMEEMTETCSELGLCFCISNRSWYYPGLSLCVVVRRQDYLEQIREG